MARLDIGRGIGAVVSPSRPFVYGAGLVLTGGVSAVWSGAWLPCVLCVLGLAVLVLAQSRLPEACGVRFTHLPSPPPRRGLICLVSNRETIEFAVQYHAATLTRLWLVVSHQKAAVAGQLLQDLPERYPQVRIVIKNLRDDETVDHRGVERVVDEIYDELGEEGLATADIIADFTGGTKAMTCGMIMACLDEGRDCQYVPQDEQQRMHPPILIQVTPDP